MPFAFVAFVWALLFAGLVGVLLVLTRLKTLPFLGWVKSWKLSTGEMFGTGIAASVEPLYLPGTIFMVVSLITIMIHKMTGQETKTAWADSAKMLAGPALALLFAALIVDRLAAHAGLIA